MTRRIAVEIFAFAGFLLLAIILTWPLAARLGTIVSDNGDPLLNTWIVDWDCYALVRHPLTIFQAPMYFPAKYPLAYSENLLGIALIVLPLSLAGVPPLTMYNVAMLLGFALSGYGAFVLARLCTRSTSAAIVAGILYGFVQFRFDHLAHLQIIWGGWLPLILAALLHFRRSPTPGRAALLCGALIMNGLTNVHWLLFGFVAFGLAVLFLAAAGDAARGMRFWAMLAGATVLSIIVLLPILLPYKTVSEMYHMRRDPQEALDGSASWNDWLVANDRNAVYGRLPSEETSRHERRLFPGLMMILLTCAGAIAYRRATFDTPQRSAVSMRFIRTLDVIIVVLAVFSYLGAVAPRYVLRVHGHQLLALRSSDIPLMMLLGVLLLRSAFRLPGKEHSLGDALRTSRLPVEFWVGVLWVAIGLAGSFGLHGFFHTFLYWRVEAFRSIRIPARWAMIVYVGLSLTAAYGVAALTAESARWRRVLASMGIIVLALNDVRTNIVWDQAVPDAAPVYRWLNDVNLPGGVLELPVERENAQYLYLLSATAHHRPLLNGTSGFEPPPHWRLRELTMENVIGDEFIQRIIEDRCAVVVVHGDYVGEQGPKYRKWLRKTLLSGRLTFLRRFDHGVWADWVFAVTPVFRDWQRLRAPEVPDRAGRTPSQNLALMLEEKPTYNGITFGLLDRPRSWEELGSPFEVAGWAASPDGVRDVILRFNLGRQRFRADFVPRPDIEGLFPWYPFGAAPGFGRTFAHRPRGVPKRTDLQVEIVDGRGVRTLLPVVMVQWP